MPRRTEAYDLFQTNADQEMKWELKKEQVRCQKAVQMVSKLTAHINLEKEFDKVAARLVERVEELEKAMRSQANELGLRREVNEYRGLESCS